MTVSNQVAEASGHYLAEDAGQVVPVGYKQTEAGVIPENWYCCNLGDALTLQRGFDLPQRFRNEGNVPIISSSGESGKHDKAMVAAPGIVTGRYGTIGEIFYIQEPFWPLNTTLYVSKFNHTSAEYAYYLLQTVDFDSHSGKSGVPGVNRNDVHQEKIAIPPIPEQTAIANALADVDALINELEKLIAKKQAIKNATMQQLLTGRTRLAAFSGKLKVDSGELNNPNHFQLSTLNSQLKKGYKQTELGEIPEDWEVTSLGDIGQCVLGLTYSPNDVADFGTLVLRSSNVQGNRLAFEDNVYVQMDLPERVIVKKGDILVCVRNGSRQLIGKCALIDAKAEGSAFGAFMSVFRTQSYGFIFYQFQSDIIQNQINEIMGATINQITNKDMGGFKIPLPKLEEEQTAIATILSEMDSDIQTLQQRLSKTRQIKQGMMQELLTGRIRLISGKLTVESGQ